MSGALGRLYRGQTNIDFVGRRRVWFALSGVLLVLSGVILAIGGGDEASQCGSTWPLKGLSCGIEFKGGVQVSAPIDPNGPLGDASDTDVIEAVRDAIGEFGAQEAQIQISGEGSDRQVLVQTKEIADPDAQRDFSAAVSDTVGADITETDVQRIGSKWGSEITNKALRALIIFLFVILAFISWRFEVKMGIGAIVALFHDLIITAGVYALVGFDVTPSTVIAILTILGYSLYDTVVVFDKVEEKTASLAATGRTTYQDAANGAMNEVFMRSLNTSLATLLPVAALLFVGAGLLGASTLEDLALALFVGILVGTYSSIFVATPVLVTMKEREPRFQQVRARIAKDAAKAAATSQAASTPDAIREPAEVGAAQTGGAVTPTPAPSSSAPAARPRYGSKKAKRRKKR